MKCPRSRAAAIVASFVVALLLTGTTAASADTTAPGSYHAKADATALELTVFGQGLTFGVTHAENASDPKSAASGLGALIPAIGNQVEQTASASEGAPSDSKPEVCGPITLPPEFPVLDLATACSQVGALLADGFPSSVADAGVATVDVNANAVLGDVTSALNEPIGELLTGLQPVFDGLDEASGIDAESLLNEIIEAITADGDLVRVTLGPSHSESGATPAIESALASAQGAVIEVLPRDVLELDPVITIEVGASKNSISIDRATGIATVDFDPAIVRVTLADDIVAALPDGTEPSVEVAPGQSKCLGLPAPLESCITVAGGSQGTTPEGVTHGEASGVSLHLLTGVEDGIRLNLAATSVEGVGALETAREAPPGEDLARTGGSTPLALMATLVGVGFVGATLSRTARRRELLR